MTTKTLSSSDLAQFTGSDNWYRHGINRNLLYTDGAQHVAKHGGASERNRHHPALQQGCRRRGISGLEARRTAPIEPLRLRVTMATATSCSPRRSSTLIFR